jgi:hypothetical protein
MSWIRSSSSGTTDPVPESESEQESEQETERPEHIANTNASLPKNLNRFQVGYVDSDSGRWLDIDADKSNPAAMKAIRQSKSSLRNIDADSTTAEPDTQATQREDTG